MSINQILENAQEAINKAQGATIAQMSYQRTAAIERFERNLSIWFPEEARKEFIFDHLVFEWVRENSGYSLKQTFTWRGAECYIFSGTHYKDRAGERSKLSITVRNIDPHSHNWQKEISLPTEAVASDVYYNLDAKPLDLIYLGSLLIETLNALKMQTEALKLKAQNDHDHKLSSACDLLRWKEDQASVNALLEDLLTKFPDPDDKKILIDQSDEVKKNILARLDQIRISQEQQKEIQKERDRLEHQILRMFRPFVIYKITYGFPGNSEEESEAYTEEAFITRPEPDSSGWYMRVKYGNFTKARFFNVISIDEVICNTPEDVPSSVLKRDYLTHPEFDISIPYFIQPKPGLHYLFPAED